MRHAITTSLNGCNQIGFLTQLQTDLLSEGGQFGQKLNWKYYLVQSKLGKCFATITISQETSIKVHDVGSQYGEERLLDLPQLSLFQADH